MPSISKSSDHAQPRTYCLSADIHLTTPMHVESADAGWYDPATGRISRAPVGLAPRCALTASADLGGAVADGGALEIMVPVIPAELLASRLLRIAQRDVRECGRALMVCGPVSLHGECFAVAEPMHQLLTSLGCPETANAQLQAKLRQIDQKACLRIDKAFPVLKVLRDAMDPEPQVMALPFREMGDMTAGVLVKPMRLLNGRLLGRIEPQESNTIESSAPSERDSHGVTNRSRDLRIDALELVRAGISFHLEIRVETSSAEVVRTVSSWLQCLMREAQIGACGLLGHGLGRFECKASGLYLVSAQTGRATQLTRLFRARQTGYSFCKHPLLA